MESKPQQGWASGAGPSQPRRDGAGVRGTDRPDSGRPAINCLEDHPNQSEVLGVLAQLATLSDSDLEPLATTFANTVVRAAARGRALSPDAPLVFEVLAVFDGIATIFAEDVAGDADYITVDPAVTVAALNAARDAVAAAYARPVLSKSHYQVLMAPWRAVFGRTDVVEPDFGPGGAQIRSLLTGLSWLASRCRR